MSESVDSSNIFKNQLNSECKNFEDFSVFESGRSEVGMDEENKFFFLNFVHSSEWDQDDVSAVQSNYQAKPATPTKSYNELCEVHKLPFVAFWAVHEELVCEDWTESTKHVDHNDKILLLKAAAQDIINKISNMINQMLKNDEFLNEWSNLKLKKSFRDMISQFFESIHEKLRELEKDKLNELNTFFQSLNWEDVSSKAEFLQKRQTQLYDFVDKLKNEFQSKKFSKIIDKSKEIKEQIDLINFHQQEMSQLKKDYEKHKDISFIMNSDGCLKTLQNAVNDSIKFPTLTSTGDK